MREAIERAGTSWRAKTACWLLAALTVAAALAGHIFATFGHRNGVAAALIVVSSSLAIGLCVLLLHLFDKQSDETRATVYGRLLHGLILHALFVGITVLVYATNDLENAMISLIVAVALADAALTATLVFLLAGVRRNWNGRSKTWVWIALLLGLAVFALRFFGIDWLIWAVIAALAAAAVIMYICKLKTCSNWCSLIFALAVAILAAVMLIGEYALKTHMILHLLCLILTPIYALALFSLDWANRARLACAGTFHCARSSSTVIYNHAKVNAAASAKSGLDAAKEAEIGVSAVSMEKSMLQAQKSDCHDAAEAPQTKRDMELTAIREKTHAWKADEEYSSDAPMQVKEETEISLETDTKKRRSKTIPSDRKMAELNCDMALKEKYRLLSLRYLSIAPLEAFSEITEQQLACLEAFGAHTVSGLAALPMFRVAEQIVWMASREDNTRAN